MAWIPIEFDEFASSLHDDARAGRACFLVGAGVSALPPSSLPLGRALRDNVLQRLMGSFWDSQDVAPLRASTKYKELLPEVAFSDVYSIIGEKVFDAFDVLNAAPNALHELLALFSTSGAQLLTTNFDLLLERAGAKDVVHLHGDIENPRTLGILLSNVGTPVSKATADAFIERSASKTLYVLGYSGYDRDIVSLLAHSKLASIRWLVRSRENVEVLANIDVINRVPVLVGFGNLAGLLGANSQRQEVQGSGRDAAPGSVELDEPEKHLLLSLLYYRIQEYRRSVEEARWCVGNAGLSNTQQVRAVNFMVDALRFSSGDLAEAQRQLVQTLSEDGFKGLDRLELLNQLATCEVASDSYSGAQTTLEAALSILMEEEAKDHDARGRRRAALLRSQVHNNLGVVHYNLGRLSDARQAVYVSLRIKRRIGNVHGEMASCANLALIHAALGRKTRSQAWLAKLQRLAPIYSGWHRLIEILADIADLEQARGDRVAALDAYTRARTLLLSEAPAMTKTLIRLENAISKLGLSAKQ